MTAWEIEEHPTYECARATINGHPVRVCLTNESHLVGRAAHYWDIEIDHPDIRKHPAGRVLGGVWLDGWSASVAQAKRDAVAAARRLEPR